MPVHQHTSFFGGVGAVGAPTTKDATAAPQGSRDGHSLFPFPTSTSNTGINVNQAGQKQAHLQMQRQPAGSCEPLASWASNEMQQLQAQLRDYEARVNAQAKQIRRQQRQLQREEECAAKYEQEQEAVLLLEEEVKMDAEMRLRSQQALLKVKRVEVEALREGARGRSGRRCNSPPLPALWPCLSCSFRSTADCGEKPHAQQCKMQRVWGCKSRSSVQSRYVRDQAVANLRLLHCFACSFTANCTFANRRTFGRAAKLVEVENLRCSCRHTGLGATLRTRPKSACQFAFFVAKLHLQDDAPSQIGVPMSAKLKILAEVTEMGYFTRNQQVILYKSRRWTDANQVQSARKCATVCMGFFGAERRRFTAVVCMVVCL